MKDSEILTYLLKYNEWLFNRGYADSDILDELSLDDIKEFICRLQYN